MHYLLIVILIDNLCNILTHNIVSLSLSVFVLFDIFAANIYGTTCRQKINYPKKVAVYFF